MAIGVVVGLGKGRKPGSAWVAGLLIATAVALLLEMGVSHPDTGGIVTWLDSHIAPYRGLRDAGKWAALLALVYSQLVGLGADAILTRVKAWQTGTVRSEWVGAVAAGLLLALPLYYGNGLLFGAHGEIKPSQYPAGWYQADRLLSADQPSHETLFLPWHEYMSYSFIRNQNPVVAAPAPAFFSVPILASSNPEVTGVVPPMDPAQAAIASLVAAGRNGRWAEVLATQHVKYVLLDRDVDWRSYSYLDSQSGLVKVADFGSIVVYRNSLVA
jgi:hypothetical protein